MLDALKTDTHTNAHLSVVVARPWQEAQARHLAAFPVLPAAVAADHLREVLDTLYREVHDMHVHQRLAPPCNEGAGRALEALSTPASLPVCSSTYLPLRSSCRS